MIPVKLPWGECHKTSLIRSQHWFRWWLGAVRQQTITWANVDQDSWRLMSSLAGNNTNQNYFSANLYFKHGYRRKLHKSLLDCQTVVLLPVTRPQWVNLSRSNTQPLRCTSNLISSPSIRLSLFPAPSEFANKTFFFFITTVSCMFESDKKSVQFSSFYWLTNHENMFQANNFFVSVVLWS